MNPRGPAVVVASGCGAWANASRSRACSQNLRLKSGGVVVCSGLWGVEGALSLLEDQPAWQLVRDVVREHPWIGCGGF